MKTKLLSPWNVKVGDSLVIIGPHGGQSSAKIIYIHKGRAHFFRANKWTFVVKEPVYGDTKFSYYGKYMAEGMKFEPQKVAILKK